MVQAPTTLRLLPHPSATRGGQGEAKKARRWDYIYEQAPRDILSELLHRYIRYRSVSRHRLRASPVSKLRMVAMKAATDNGGQLIDDLQLLYGKARRACHYPRTGEGEIVSGAQLSKGRKSWSEPEFENYMSVGKIVKSDRRGGRRPEFSGNAVRVYDALKVTADEASSLVLEVQQQLNRQHCSLYCDGYIRRLTSWLTVSSLQVLQSQFQSVKT